MRRLALVALALALGTLTLAAAEAKKFGTPLTLKETTKISAIFASNCFRAGSVTMAPSGLIFTKPSARPPRVKFGRGSPARNFLAYIS